MIMTIITYPISRSSKGGIQCRIISLGLLFGLASSALRIASADRNQESVEHRSNSFQSSEEGRELLSPYDLGREVSEAIWDLYKLSTVSIPDMLLMYIFEWSSVFNGPRDFIMINETARVRNKS